LDKLKTWITANTPESALIVALLADLSGYLTGSLTAHDAILAGVGAIVAFVLAEAGKDGRENQRVQAPAAPPAPVAPPPA
jgi:hypothetical protein